MTSREAQQILANAGVKIATGLSAAELEHAERQYGFTFPPDLREFLITGLPVSNGWIDWRAGDEGEIWERLRWPLEGMCFDIENNAFWLKEWGERPGSLEDALTIARRAVAAAPVLIPICGHRYISADPCEVGNPVFSVYQTDIIHYGVDLMDYLHNEFGYYFGRPSYQISGTPRRIAFWSRVVEENGG